MDGPYAFCRQKICLDFFKTPYEFRQFWKEGKQKFDYVYVHMYHQISIIIMSQYC